MNEEAVKFIQGQLILLEQTIEIIEEDNLDREEIIKLLKDRLKLRISLEKTLINGLDPFEIP